MTDHCYVAVKGSLHSTDSSVFGLSREEIIALSKKFSAACAEIINGYLLKVNPIEVINALGEIGYRVICSSGETEIVWTLRREVLVSKKSIGQEDNNLRIEPSKFISLGQNFLPQKTVSGTVRKSLTPTSKSGEYEGNIRSQSQTPTAVKAVERKKPERLGSKPEDKAEYGNKLGSTIDIRDLESIEETPPPAEKKIILNTNLSSECNPLSSKNLEPQKHNNFVSTYSETISRPAEMTAAQKDGVACEMVCRPASARSRTEKKQTFPTPGANPEVVLAEYTAESRVCSPVVNKQTPKTLSACQRSVPGTQNTRPQIIEMNQNIPPQYKSANQKVCMPSSAKQNVQRKKTNDVIGMKPEDLAQYGTKNRKIEVIEINNFEEMPEEEAMERRLILNTNRSSEENPLSTRNVEPQEDLMARFPASSRRQN